MHEVTLRKDARRFPYGSHILAAFDEEFDWLVERGSIVAEVSVDQTNDYVFCKFNFEFLQDAVLFKLTWAAA